MKKSKLRFLTCLAVCVLCMSAFSVTAFAGGGPEFEETEPIETVSEPESGEPLSEETDIVTRDLLYDKATNKQFITIEDRDGNIFYLVIDYDAPVNEDEEQFKTYFLNPVDTDDLAALAEEEETAPVVCTCSEKCAAGAVNTSCPVCATNMTECAGIICQANGRPIMTEHLNKRFKEVLEAMGDPTIDPSEIVFHSIRHTSAGVKLRLSGGDLKAVQGDGGWSTPDMVTKRYAHILDEDRRMLASEMEQQFYQQGGATIQPAATEKASAMDANALAALLTSNPELLTKVLQSIQTANNG